MARCDSCDPDKVMHSTVISVFTFLALVSIILRLWARTIKKVRLELSDYLCIGGLVFALGLTVLTNISYVHWGFPSRSVALDAKLVIIQFKTLLVGQLLWITAVTLIRASVIFLYIRIFCTKTFRNICYSFLAINLLYFTATVLACCLICRPFASIWDQSIHGTCGNSKSLDLFIGVFNLLLDITTVVLPMPVLWGLQMPTGRKIAISGMFSLAIAICIVTLVRIKVTTGITSTNIASRYALIALLTSLETSLGIINACLPVMMPVFEQLKLIWSTSPLAAWTSKHPRLSLHTDEKPVRPKCISRSLGNQPEWNMQRSSQESAMDLRSAMWTPPSPTRKDLEA